MTVVSSKEFAIEQDKYLDLAVSGNVCIKSDKYMFHLLCRPIEQDEESIIFKPDDEFRSCITMDEVRTRTRKGIHQIFSGVQK